MGLVIKGKKTGDRIDRSYSNLHYTTRWLALLWCGMPKTIGNEIDSMKYYIDKYKSYKKDIDSEKMEDFVFALVLGGRYFPNILLHSDCEGCYTKNGKCDPKKDPSLMRGNSKKLLKELNVICRCISFIESDDERIIQALKETIEFRDLVKNEIENGNGTIIFTKKEVKKNEEYK